MNIDLNAFLYSLPAKLNEMLSHKNMHEFKFVAMNPMANKLNLVILIEFNDATVNRRLTMRFEFELTDTGQGVFAEDDGDLELLDDEADINNKRINIEAKALLRILYTVFYSCAMFKKDGSEWRLEWLETGDKPATAVIKLHYFGAILMHWAE